MSKAKHHLTSGFLGLLLGGLGATIIFIASLRIGESDRLISWLSDFARSPGISAVAVFAASIIAFTGISRQVKVSRESLVQAEELTRKSLDRQRESDADDSWWKTFEWAADRAVPAVETQQPFPFNLVVNTLQALKDSTTDPAKLSACAGIINRADEIDKARSADGTGSGRTIDTLPQTIEALNRWSVTSRGTAAESGQVDSRLYELNVESKLHQLGFELRDPRAFWQKPGARYIPDAVVDTSGRRIVVETKYWAPGRRRRESDVSRAVSNARVRGIRNPMVLVTPAEVLISEEEQLALCVRIAQWAGSDDDKALERAIQEAASLPEWGGPAEL